MNKPSSSSIILAFALIWTAATRPVHAYLDPGTGSMVFQVALASLFGVLLAVKTFWIQIKHFVLTKVLGKKVEAEEVVVNKKNKA